MALNRISIEQFETKRWHRLFQFVVPPIQIGQQTANRSCFQYPASKYRRSQTIFLWICSFFLYSNLNFSRWMAELRQNLINVNIIVSMSLIFFPDFVFEVMKTCDIHGNWQFNKVHKVFSFNGVSKRCKSNISENDCGLNIPWGIDVLLFFRYRMLWFCSMQPKGISWYLIDIFNWKLWILFWVGDLKVPEMSISLKISFDVSVVKSNPNGFCWNEDEWKSLLKMSYCKMQYGKSRWLWIHNISK